MRKAAIFALCFAATGNSLSSPVETPPMDSKVSPWSFRQFTDHHKQPCADASYQCLAKHLMYLQCGAVLVEKLALREGEVPQWYAYSMHSGPKVLFAVAGYFVLSSFDPSLPASWYSGDEFDPMESIDLRPEVVVRDQDLASRGNQRLAEFVQQTIDWLDSRNRTMLDACELQLFWTGLRSGWFEQREGG